ncbi:hypothetical protein Ndes2526B_g08562 [Nannochloris sp. 'desiccata']|nr:hypothetical protein KSW81_001843 [Chlorella desiccata (nom. nud.)]KAH7616284.1 putative Peptidyl-prolyl cis-trans isomerase FKBP20-2, chloroplastic [Chlorella desiccata (nom. nud.)]KAH7616470.1 putative Peptidyl-prolyl cis-trans isomerase FKBP20-2, chloroplastic [Chlorella desiccata (nom. nud.)]
MQLQATSTGLRAPHLPILSRHVYETSRYAPRRNVHCASYSSSQDNDHSTIPATAALTRRALFGGAVALGAAISNPPAYADTTSVIDGQGQTRVLPITSEEDLSIPERQVLEYNKRTQRQNSAPPDFPLFVREGFDMTVLTPEGYQVTSEGIIYKDYAEGTGNLPEEGQQVTFDYTAYNESAAVIDSSYRKGQPAQTRIGIQGLIPGFEMGIRTMKPGGKRRIVVPPELGPPVGPSTFFSAKQFEVFDVELRAAKTCVRRTVGMFSDVVCE